MQNKYNLTMINRIKKTMNKSMAQLKNINISINKVFLNNINDFTK